MLTGISLRVSETSGGKITLLFTDIHISCPSREFLTLHAICENKILGKIFEFTVEEYQSEIPGVLRGSYNKICLEFDFLKTDINVVFVYQALLEAARLLIST